MSLRYGRLFDETVRAEYQRALTLAKQQLGPLPASMPGGRATLPLLEGDWKQAPARLGSRNRPAPAARRTPRCRHRPGPGRMNSQRIHAVEHACAQLAAHGEPVTFAAVSRRSAIPGNTLYRNPALCALLEEHRAKAQHATTLTGLATQLASQQLTLGGRPPASRLRTDVTNVQPSYI